MQGAQERRRQPMAKLEELARLRRRVRYAEQQLNNESIELDRQRLGAALLARLSWTMRRTYLELLEYLKVQSSSTVRRDFADTYGHIMRLADTVIEQVDNLEKLPSAGFSSRISTTSMDSLIQFVEKMRTNHQWVADCLSNLSATDIESCLPSIELGLRHTNTLRENKPRSESVEDLQRSDLLYTLIFGLFPAPGLSKIEDDLRLKLSTTIMHQLLQDNKTSSKADKFCLCIMDSWCAMHGWPAAKHFETILLDILNEGTRLIDRSDAKIIMNASQSKGYFFEATRRDELEEEFFADSVRKIFRFLDNEEFGLPYGAVLLGKAILAQVSEHDRRHYEAFIINSWFFNRFLSRSITTPERHGILVDYHITDAKRQRVLQALQQKVCSYCLQTSRSASAGNSNRSSIEEEIEARVISIFSKFHGSIDSTPQQKLRPLSIDDYLTRQVDLGPRGASVHMSPLQLIYAHQILLHTHCDDFDGITESTTLIRQPSTSSSRSNRSFNRACRASKSIFNIGISQHEDGFDLTSTTTSENIEAGSACAEVDEGELYSLGRAIEELESACPTDDASWEQLILSPDGITIASPTADTCSPGMDDDQETILPALYHLLDHFDLVVARESPQMSPYFGRIDTKLETDLPSGMHRKAYHSASTLQASLLQQLLAAGQMCFSRRDYSTANMYYRAYSVLQQKLHTPEAIDNFSPLIHTYCVLFEARLQALELLLEDNLDSKCQAQNHKAKLSQKVDEQISSFAKLRLRMWYQTDVVKSKLWNQAWEVVKSLHKMKRQDQVLAKDGPPTPNSDHMSHYTSMTRSSSRDRHLSRFSRDYRPVTPRDTATMSNIHVVNQHIFDVLTGGSESIVPNKLSAEQSRHTQLWMQESDIQNLCSGEEGILRLCLEVDDLLRRLLGMITHPHEDINMEDAAKSKIWRCDFFQYENKVFNITSRSQESYMSEFSTHEGDSGRFTGLLRRGSAGDLLNLSRNVKRNRGNSVGSLDTPQQRIQLNRVSSGNALDTMHAATEQKVQFSPIRSGERSRPNVQRYSSATSDSTAAVDPQDEQAIKDFLLQTQLGVTSLLLTDFSDALYRAGSETDEWFNDDVTDLVVNRRPSVDHDLFENETTSELASLQRSVPISVLSETVVSKAGTSHPKHIRKKSLSISHLFNGSSAYEHLKATLVPPSVDTGMARSSSGIDMDRINSKSSSYFDLRTCSEFSVTPCTPMRSTHDYSSHPQKFPTMKAYKDILHRFSISPAPYEKLRALYEFELLVVSTLMAVEDAPVIELPKLAPAMPSTPLVTTIKGHATTSPTVMKTRARKDSVDISKARVEELTVPPVPITPLLLPRSDSIQTVADTPGADTIVEEIQRILRFPDVRPKTIYRDLQYIASFIPAHILNMTDEGKVFWDFSLAALAVRRESLDLLVDHASERLAAASKTASAVPGITKLDCVRLLVNAAKERHVKAMRELGLLMLREPNLCPIVLPPFCDPSVLKGDNANGLKIEISCIKSRAAQVWLQRAASDGDRIAKQHLVTDAFTRSNENH